MTDGNVSPPPVEVHPFEPFIPSTEPRVLIMGTFPPGAHRWKMPFYYPNPTNDFWRMMGLVFLDDQEALYDRATRTFRLDDIKALLNRHGIAMSDTGEAVRRLRGNASDAFLEIVRERDIAALRRLMPSLKAIAATGEKAASVAARQLGIDPPPGVGVFRATSDSALDLWRLPSTSRAYPLPLEQKAKAYRAMFEHEGLLAPK